MSASITDRRNNHFDGPRQSRFPFAVLLRSLYFLRHAVSIVLGLGGFSLSN